MNTWKAIVEIEFPLTDDDMAILHEGDSEADFSARAMERVKKALDAALEPLGRDAHYLIVRQPFF